LFCWSDNQIDELPAQDPMTRQALLLIVAALVGTIPASAEVQGKPKPAVNANDVALRIHRLINTERKKRKLAPLAWDTRLTAIAAAHSRDMVRRNYMSHVSPEGHGFDRRYRLAGYKCRVRVGNTIHIGAENIALGRLYNSVKTRNSVATYDWNSPEAIARKAVDGWMQSTGHRENILTPHWRRQGIGIEIAPENRVLITQNFC